MAALELYLLITCQACGKKYKIPAEKLKRKKLIFPCKNCNAQVPITRPDILEPKCSKAKEKGRETQHREKADGGIPTGATDVPKRMCMLMFCVFFLVMLGMVCVVDFRLRDIHSQSLKAGSETVEFISKKMVAQLSEVMAENISHYLLSHPFLKREDFNADVYLRKSVLQKFGITGTTWLYAMGKDRQDWRLWVDYSSSRVGRRIREMRGVLGAHFPEYWNIMTGVESMKGSAGITKWPDSKGVLRDKFIAISPVEGTPFFVGASIFMDELVLPFERIEAEGNEAVRRTTLLALSSVLISAALFLIVTVATFRRVGRKNK